MDVFFAQAYKLVNKLLIIKAIPFFLFLVDLKKYDFKEMYLFITCPEFMLPHLIS